MRMDVWTITENGGRYRVLGEIEEDLSYEFNILRVWRDNNGKHWWATDSGCSCPSPFESTSEKDLNPLVRETIEEFKAAVRDFPASQASKNKLLEAVLPLRINE